ncbi:MAG: hypothetical protein DRI44_04505 [Chlamydiae bacterium]|nr:MAG: hypothetical protein DRI44_04505 [Chlamydiota bacterium]
MKKHSYYFKLAISEFHVHKKRFNLTALAIAWGTCSILVLLAFGQGMKDRLGDTIKRIGDNIIMVRGRRTSIPYRGLAGRRKIALDQDDVALLKTSLPELKYVGGVYKSWGKKAMAEKKEADIEITGVDGGYGLARYLMPIQNGRFINLRDVSEKKRVIFMGCDAAEKFFNLNDAVGKTLLVQNVPFTIIGLLEKKELSASFGSDENSRTYIPSSTFAALYGNIYYDRLIISIKNPDDAEYVQQRIRNILGSKHSFNPDDETAIKIRNTMEMTKKLGSVMLGFQVLLGFIGGITLMISGVGLANIMYASIKQRTREIGVKIAIGAQPDQIRKQIIVESFFFSIAGGCLGGLMAFMIITLLSQFPLSNKALQFFMNARLSFNVWIATSIVLVIITFLAGYFPAKTASQQNPIDSLRYE